MSLVVAIKDGNRFVLGADKQISSGNVKEHTFTKVWEVKDIDSCVMGSVGYARASQVIQYSYGLINKNLISPEELTEEYIVNHLANTIRMILEENDISAQVAEDKSLIMAAIPNVYIFCYKDKGWIINYDLSVTEISDYVAIGSGAEVARGVLFATKDKDPFERIIMSIDAASTETIYVDNSVEFQATEVYEDDEDKIIKALNQSEEMNDDIMASENDVELDTTEQNK